MLVLTRRAGELIEIGEDVTIQVLRTKRNEVRLGIVAPANIPVLRQELAAKLHEPDWEATDD